VIISSSDKAIIGYLLPAASAIESVAVYSIAATMASILMIFTAAIELAFLPLLSKFVGMNDLGKVRDMTEMATRWVLLSSVPMAVVMAVYSSEMLGTVYGDAFIPGALAMSILVVGLLVKSASSMMMLSLAAMRRVKLELALTIIVAILNVAFNWLLIPSFGIEGAAIGTSASFLILSLLLLYHSMKLFGFRLRAEYFKIIICGILLFGLMMIVRPYAVYPASDSLSIDYLSKALYIPYLGLLTALGFLIFGALCIALRCFVMDDVNLLGTVLRKARLPEGLTVLALRLASMGVAAK
jgi:stage V sporulation protein B